LARLRRADAGFGQRSLVAAGVGDGEQVAHRRLSTHLRKDSILVRGEHGQTRPSGWRRPEPGGGAQQRQYFH
jgi:hypothetical protein